MGRPGGAGPTGCAVSPWDRLLVEKRPWSQHRAQSHGDAPKGWVSPSGTAERTDHPKPPTCFPIQGPADNHGTGGPGERRSHWTGRRLRFNVPWGPCVYRGTPGCPPLPPTSSWAGSAGDTAGSGQGSATDPLCGLGQVSAPLWAREAPASLLPGWAARKGLQTIRCLLAHQM